MGHWDRKNVPQKGWECIDFYDLCADANEVYATCEMCGQERIRYVHVMRHPDFYDDLLVGCVCAGKMSDDYVNPEKREKILSNRSKRRKSWLSRTWRVSAKGNDFLNVKGHNVTIFPAKHRLGHWCFKIDDDFNQNTYEDKNRAKLAAFDLLQKYNEKI